MDPNWLRRALGTGPENKLMTEAMKNTPESKIRKLIRDFEHAVRMSHGAGASMMPDYTAAVQKTREELIAAFLAPSAVFVSPKPAEVISFLYVNYVGQREWREVQPKSWRYGPSQYHLEPDWLLTAFDPSRKEEREFALGGIIAVQMGTSLVVVRKLPE